VDQRGVGYGCDVEPGYHSFEKQPFESNWQRLAMSRGKTNLSVRHRFQPGRFEERQMLAARLLNPRLSVLDPTLG
jgi:hypothetical protein